MSRHASLLLTIVLVLVSSPLAFGESPLNGDFTKGGEKPEGWKLEGGQGRWVDRQILEVSGNGEDSCYWRSAACNLASGALYHFEMRARRPSGSGSAIAGPNCVNRDYYEVPSDWKWLGHVFRAPDKPAGAYLRVGQWHSQGSLQFDAVRLTPCLPVYKSTGGLVLGDGETIREGKYQFLGTYAGLGSNFHRTLVSATASFNSDRWGFGGDGQITYRFMLPGYRFLNGSVGFTVNYHTKGGCVAEVSRDQQQWVALCKQDGLGSGQATLPSELLPARVLFLRLRTATPQSSFQVNRVEFQAKLSGTPPEASGKTSFADLRSTSPELAIDAITLDCRDATDPGTFQVVARNTTSSAVTATFTAEFSQDGKPKARQSAASQDGEPAARPPAAPVEVKAKGTLKYCAYMPSEPGDHEVTLTLNPAGGQPAKLTLMVTVPDYYRTDYGQLIAGASGTTAVWWCEATHKIARKRLPPTAATPAASLAAAKNDREAVQIVVRPNEPLKGLTATAGALAGPAGAVIPAENVKILQVYYHFVDHPTDRTGVRDFWPDALPPLDKPIDVAARENQPLWVLVHVPADAEAGDYTGKVELKAEGWSATVPVRLHVWNYTLPERNHLATAFGLSPGEIFRYHQLKTEADRRKVLDLYFQSFAEHRISPYDPTPLDRIRVKFLPEANPPRAEVDFTAFDAAMARAVEKYHFTNLRLPIEGMGGGTFHERHEPQIGKFGEATPQYQAMFSSYVKQIESHLRDKGWLDMAYIYWFDEPDPKDYAFVRGGMERLKKYAAGLKTMLTEEPVDALAGPIDIWCPVTPNYSHPAAEKRRAHNERFWWYVCCGPKAPYCTLFIDHPATELRVWLWQTWQRDVRGILVWESNYWTSIAAYPDKPQNPYDDPMGYVSGYSTPKGTKQFWGNGDGRFLYPPLAAAAPGASGPTPILAGPVSSIRWEMLREGIEDYESLYLLRDLLAKQRDKLSPDRVRQLESLLQVPETVTRDMTTFATDPSPLYARRAAIAEAIEQLTK